MINDGARANRAALPAIFLDRDGVLNENRADYVKSWAEFRWIPGALDGLVALSRLEIPIIVVTNQSMIGRGRSTLDELEHIHARMLCAVRERTARIDGILYCPHQPDDGCCCRKPEPGLLVTAARSWGIDLPRSVVIGDSVVDARMALVVGARYIHVCTGLGERDLPSVQALAAKAPIVADLVAAVPVCLAMLTSHGARATRPPVSPPHDVRPCCNFRRSDDA